MEGLTDMSWHCNVPESCAPASGTGGVSTIVALPVGDTVVIRVSATVDPDASFTELVVGAEPPEGFVLVGDDTTAASGGSANNDGIFRSRFFDW